MAKISLLPRNRIGRDIVILLAVKFVIVILAALFVFGPAKIHVKPDMVRDLFFSREQPRSP
ncbi:MAG: hypothetical protein GC131_09340 [Alphaproteobacteria bacterium]|nr:hypothetical protein [Alphaproteobacteria bacterium]